MRRPLLAAVQTAAFSLVLALPATAQVTVFDPTNFTKNTLTEIHTLQVTINQTMEIANQLRQLAYEVQNLRSIPHGLWEQTQTELDDLARVAKIGQNISYADTNLSAEFARMYPGYVAPSDYASAYRQWSGNALGGIRGALASAGMQSAQLTTEGVVIAQLQALSNGATGHLQALQVGNMIAVQQVDQLEKLRQLQMAQMQGEFGYLATQQQHDDAKEATLRAWLDEQAGYQSHE
jgi:P-type conjugative transfer protein TrbJ